MIDTHCHIDEEAFLPDQEEAIQRQRESGVEAMIVPGVNAASIPTVLDVCRRHPGYCYPALGLHPEDVKADWQTQLDIVEKAIRAHRDELVAIGEIGLDYYWDKTYKAEQQEVLRRQLTLARELDLPVILHNRESTEDIINCVKAVSLQPSAFSPLRGVFHCFSGSKETAEQVLRMGFHLGIGGVLTFKNSKLGDQLAALYSSTPSLLDSLMLETDAPYMAPVPHRGERNESRWMIHVAERLAETFGVTKETIIEATNRNARRLFGIK